jgi:hypothetical protein
MHTGILGARRVLRGALLAWGATLVVGLLAASPAFALTIDDVTPLFFDGPGGQGFAPASVAAIGRTPDATATPADLFLAAGGPTSGAPVVVVSQVISQIQQLPSVATPEDPAIVDSTWTLRNASGGPLLAPLLLFTVLDPLDTYPGDPAIGLDADLLRLLAYSAGGTDYVYGAAALPDLADGESAEILVRYVVAGPLVVQDASELLAPLGLAVAASYTSVPEPSTGLLLGGALAGLAAAERRRERARGARA